MEGERAEVGELVTAGGVVILGTEEHGGPQLVPQGRVQKILLNRLVEFSIKWVGGVPLVH